MTFRGALQHLTGRARDHVLARGVFLKLLALVYLAAFASLGVQVSGLLGAGGIQPARDLFELLRANPDGPGFFQLPSLFWLSASDGMLVGACVLGAALSLAVGVGLSPRWALGAQWFLYLSLVNAGGVFLRYQWDTLLLETGLLAVFLAPGGLWPERLGGRAPRRWAVLLLWFLLLRLMVMAGLVKLLSGDPTWRDLTALDYHFWTQPLPTRIAGLAAALPGAVHKALVVGTLAIELGAPLLILFGRWPRRIAAALLGCLQLLILVTGNYGYFNFLTLALCLLLLDDDVWRRVLGPRASAWLGRADAPEVEPVRAPLRIAGAVFFAALVYLQAYVAFGRLIRPEPPRVVAAVLRTLDPFHAINGYGLFAVMTTTRPEIVVEASLDGATWLPYEFPHKPGDPARPPELVAPHQPRLDWQMWFAALGTCRQNGWFLDFQRRLLEARPEVLGLLEVDPLRGKRPRYVRATLYQYRLAQGDAGGAFWARTPVGPYCPTLTLDGGRLRAVALP